MLNKISLVILCWAVAFGHGASARTTAKWRFRTIRIRVVDEDGRRAAGAKVQLRGMDRDAIGALSERETSKLGLLEQARKYQGWDFTTDRNGEFIARFGKFREYDYAQATGIEAPGFGEFYFVAEKEGSAGAVSPMIANYSREEAQFHQDENDRYGEYCEWMHEDYRRHVLNDRSEPGEVLVLRFQRGLVLSGQVIDLQEKPVPGATIRLFHDLHADTHTGYGGEIFERTMTTDDAGQFQFAHVYNNTFYLDLDLDRAGYWIRTRVRQRWVDGSADEITPRKNESSIQLLLIEVDESPYRYRGRVTDEQGQPIAGAKVSVYASLHSPSRTFEDDHGHHSDARTGADGTYDLGADSPYVRYFTVEAAGFENGGESGDDDDLYSPGRYDFTLKRK
jgi:hypothetical protein